MIEVIMKLGDIPERSVVRRITGTRQYIVRDKITFYHNNKQRHTLPEYSDNRFIVRRGYVTELPKVEEMVWIVSWNDFIAYQAKKIREGRTNQ